jgi:hypothetical protein
MKTAVADKVVHNKISTDDFVRDIENIVSNGNVDYMDAVITYCEKNNLEIETAASMIKSNSKMKSKLQAQAELLNFLPKTARLPI